MRTTEQSSIAIMESILGNRRHVSARQPAARMSRIIENLGKYVKLDFLTPLLTKPYDA